MQVRQRINLAKESALCFNCLQPFTRTHICSKQVCCQCHTKHHTLLHTDGQNQSINDKWSATNGPAHARRSTTAECNTYFSFKSKPRNQIPLATAIVEVQNNSAQYVPCRALLDSASHSHFITHRCVKRMRFSSIETLAQIQGISGFNTEIFHSVSIHLRSRHSDRHTTLNCAIFSPLMVPQHPTSLTQLPGKFPKTTCWLMNSLIKQEALIYSLELTYSTIYFVQAEGHVLANYPVLQLTVLGWTLTGPTPATTTLHEPQPTFLH